MSEVPLYTIPNPDYYIGVVGESGSSVGKVMPRGKGEAYRGTSPIRNRLPLEDPTVGSCLAS